MLARLPTYLAVKGVKYVILIESALLYLRVRYVRSLAMSKMVSR